MSIQSNTSFQRDNRTDLATLGLADRSDLNGTPVEAFYDNSRVDEIKQSGLFKELWR